jgi:DNA (cytosine-5)-methyltransferase 1
MNKDIVLLDLFSGIGGFSLGLTQAGFNITNHFYSEIDKHAIAVYKYQFKNSTHVGSVTSLDGRSITRPNIITFGSPCQDFSVAGKRAGLEGQRSSLIGQAIRLIAECRPDVFIWENVKGVFSSNNGEDFWAVIQAFANIGGYRLEWQLLNTAWFLPQNRERVYLIGRIGSNRSKEIFPIEESNYGHTKKIQTEIIIRGRNKNTSGCLDCRGTNAFDRSDLDKLIFCDANTKLGYEIINVGDSINFQQPKSKTRRGRIGKGIAQTLETHSCQAVYFNGIRRLTEVEHERLQGFNDGWTEYGDYNGVIRKVPSSQRYKCLGNAVTVKIVEEIGKRLLNT